MAPSTQLQHPIVSGEPKISRDDRATNLDAAYEALADDCETDAEPFFAAQRETLEER